MLICERDAVRGGEPDARTVHSGRSFEFTIARLTQPSRGVPYAPSESDDMNDSHETSSTGTALVLGGGGAAGNAWLIGVLAGLSDAGVDPAAADLIIGTSAGATTAAQVTATPAARLYADILDAPPVPPRTLPGGVGTPPSRPTRGADHLARLHATIAASADAADYRRRISAVLRDDPASADSARWRETVAARLPAASWPRQRILLTAVDAETAEPIDFERDGDADLVDAVAASTAGGFVYRIGDRGYIDGGYRSNADNADLAAGHARILVLSPLGGRSFTPFAWGTHLATQVDALRAAGSRVETLFPDEEARRAFGDNLLDPSTRLPAARAGYEQGSGLAERLDGSWG
jgi:NTE family protein